MANTDIAALIELYIDAMAEEDEPVSSPMRSNLRKITELVPADLSVDQFVVNLPAIFQGIVDRNPGAPSGSVRAWKSAASAVARWAYQDGIVSTSPELADRLGMPRQMVFADWAEAPKALTAYKALLAEMSVAGFTKEELDERFLANFLDRLPEYMADWKGGSREFRKRWFALVEDGELPDLDLPALGSKKPGSYKIEIDQLPVHLREELETVRNRLLGKLLEERLGKPFDETTVDLQIGTVLRLLGFLQRENRRDLATISLHDALALKNAKELTYFTNRRWRERNDTDEANNSIGAYEYGQLMQLSSVVRIGVRDDALASDYAEECSFVKELVQGRREALKSFGSVDGYLGVACDLIERSRALPMDGTHDVTRATFMRDALIFALQSVFADRLSVLTEMTLGEHIREGDNGTVLICIPKEQTKPGIRDLVRELPAELRGLWREYMDWARQILLGGKRDHGRLWVAQGGGVLTSGAIYAAFERRCLEHLGVRHNPHQTRKALSTDYGVWSGGDYLTVSAVIDSSSLTIQRSYAVLEEEGKIKTVDERTSEPWASIDEEFLR